MGPELVKCGDRCGWKLFSSFSFTEVPATHKMCVIIIRIVTSLGCLTLNDVYAESDTRLFSYSSAAVKKFVSAHFQSEFKDSAYKMTFKLLVHDPVCMYVCMLHKCEVET